MLSQSITDVVAFDLSQMYVVVAVATKIKSSITPPTPEPEDLPFVKLTESSDFCISVPEPSVITEKLPLTE